MRRRTKLKNDDMIRLNAYYLWEKAGCPYGREIEFWLEAESNLKHKIEDKKNRTLDDNECTLIYSDVPFQNQRQ